MTSVFDSVMASATGAVHGVFGVSALYTPAGSDAVDCTIIIDERLIGDRTTQGSNEKQTILRGRIQKSQVATITRGDTIQIDGETTVFQVTLNPVSSEDDVEWRIEASSVERFRLGGTDTLPRMG